MSATLNYIILTLLCIIVYYIASVNAKIAYGILVTLSIGFIINVNSKITKEEEDTREKMLRDPKSRYTYYVDINT